MENDVWLFATAGGAAILGAALAYGLMRQKRLTRREQMHQDEKVEDLYGKK
jgi:hypothetical protein